MVLVWVILGCFLGVSDGFFDCNGVLGDSSYIVVFIGVVLLDVVEVKICFV